MTALSNLLAILSLDDDPFLEGLNSSYKATDSFTSNLSKVGGAIGMAALTAAGAGIAAVGGFLASSIEPASDLAETVSKANVVFGESADAILKWSENSAKAMGMNQNSALAAASTYGNLFRAMEIGEETSATMSTGLVELAGDLASFNNMDPTDVLDKLRAGLSGETEPLKSLGININQALLQEKAMELGLWDGVGALDAAGKAQAAYALIMEQTTLAQGDFARTSDGLANQQRILKAQFEDIRAKVGGALLPVITQLASTLNEYLSKPEVINFINAFTEAIGRLAEQALANLPNVIAWFQNAFTFLQQNEGIVIGIFAALGVAVTAWAVTTAVAAWTAMAPFLPVIAVLVAIGAAVYFLYQAWTNNWGGIQDKMQAVWAFLQPVLQALSDIWTNTILPALQAVWSFISTYIIPLFVAVGEVIMAVIGNSIKQWAAFISNVLIPALSEMWTWIENNILPTLQKFASWVSEKVSPAIRGIGDAIQGVIGWLGGLADRISNLSLPGWLTPGSPTPFEMGLRGISDAMSDLSRSQLPTFNAALQLQPQPIGVGGGQLAVGGGLAGAGGLVVNVNVTSDGVQDEKDIARKIGAAVDVILRERGIG